MSLTDMLWRTAAIYPDNVALIGPDGTRTYREFSNNAARFAAGLIDRGCRPGDRVCMLGMNSVRFVEALFGAMWAGCIPAPLNIRLAESELVEICRLVDARGLFYDKAFAALGRRLSEGCASIETAVHLDTAEPCPGEAGFDAMLHEHCPAPQPDTEWDDPATIFFTGGTTGKPKGVVQSHGNLVSSAMMYVGYYGFTADTRLLSAGGLFHVAATAVLMPAIMAGARIVLLDRFTPEAYLDMIEDQRITFANAVPTMLGMVLDVPGVADRDLSCLRTMIFGGAPMPDRVILNAVDVFPNARFFHTYGQTELTSAGTATLGFSADDPRDEPELWTSIGFPLPSMQSSIRDEQGQPCGAGEIGELAFRGPLVMREYWNDPGATAAAIRGRWLMTGDLGYQDEAGRLFLVDRKKDMVITGGENVYSIEVEETLRSLDAVRDCAVLGLPDETWGERVHAIVVVDDLNGIDTATLDAHCRSRLAGYKCPRTYDLRDTPLPLSGAAKIAKADLRAEALAQRD